MASVVGAALAAFMLYRFARRRSTRVDARLALLVLVTMPLFYGGAQFASLDMLVTGFIFATTVLGAEAAIDAARGEPYRARLTAAYVCAALGVLAKGLIGAVLPGLTIVLWLLWCRRPSLLLKLLWWPAVALFALIAVPWFAVMQMRFPDFSRYFFIFQQVERYALDGLNNPPPFWFYVPLLVGGLFPWSLWMWRALREREVAPPESLSLRALMWMSVLVIIGFFSIPHSKMVGYSLPAIPPLAFLIADAIGRPATAIRQAGGALRWTAIAAIVMCMGTVVIARVTATRSGEDLSRRIAMERAPSELVYFYRYEYLDMPFYLRLREPARVVRSWKSEPTLGTGHDDWRNALYDAGQFDPARARQLLLDEGDFIPDLCRQPVAWVVASDSAAESSPVLRGVAPRFREHDRGAWRITGQELTAKGLCPRTPSNDSLQTSAPLPPRG
jgi:hypothetical protein